MSLTGIGRRISSVVAALFASACCSSLPRAPQKAVTELPRPASAAHRTTIEQTIWHDAARKRDVPAKLYVPATTPAPVVIISHGIGEDRESYEYLGRALASAGFLAVHLTHAGTDRSVLEKGYRYLYRAVKQKENWISRPLDVSFALDQLERDERADAAHAAVVGHSAGAFTAFAVAGLRAADDHSMRDPRVKAIVPISMPRMDGIIPPGGYDDVRVPVLHMTGTCDTSLIYRTFPRHRRVPFESTAATGHYLVTIRGVNHATFSAPSAVHHDLVASLVTAFLRGFLLGDDEARRWFHDAGRGSVDGTVLTLERK